MRSVIFDDVFNRALAGNLSRDEQRQRQARLARIARLVADIAAPAANSGARRTEYCPDVAGKLGWWRSGQQHPW